MKARSLKLKDRSFGDTWKEQVEDRWDYEDFLSDDRWREDWISFDGVVFHPKSDLVFCGITSFAGDIFKAYDRRNNGFIDLGFSEVGDRYDAKFHRSMELTENGAVLYLATALLHDIDRYWEAPGGGIYAYGVDEDCVEKVGIPVPHNYIQSICLDEKRGLIYCLHLTPELLSVFDLATGHGKVLGPVGSGLALAQGENLVLDDRDRVWSGWNLTRAWQSSPGADSNRLCRYDPNLGRIEYLSEGLPLPDGAHGYAHLEGLFNLGTGVLFASGANGSLYRVDPDTGKAEYLGTPIVDAPSRLTSLALHDDGYAYGVTGRQGNCRLLRFDPNSCAFEVGELIVDRNGLKMWQCHDVTITNDGMLYAGENDHPARSGYLWEIEL
jgi:hypothetical protein